MPTIAKLHVWLEWVCDYQNLGSGLVGQGFASLYSLTVK